VAELLGGIQRQAVEKWRDRGTLLGLRSPRSAAANSLKDGRCPIQVVRLQGEMCRCYARRRRDDQCTARICHPDGDCDNTINSTMSDPCGFVVLPGVNVDATR